MQLGNNEVWSAGLDGVWVFDPANKKIKYLNSSTGFQFDAVSTVINDSTGKIWISSLYYININRIHVISTGRDSVYTIGKAQGLDNMIVNILEVDRNQVWLTADDAIYIMNPNLMSMRKVVTNEKQYDFGHGSIMKDDQGQVWLGTRSGGINILNAKGLLPEYLDARSGLSGSSVWALAEDDGKKVWIGGLRDQVSSNSGFVNILDSAREKVFDLSKVIGKSFYQAEAMVKDKKGRILIGIAPVGLYIFDQDKKNMIYVGKQQGLLIDSKSTSTLLADSRGFYWVSTGKDIARYDPSSGRLIVLNSLLDHKTASIYCQFESSSGQVWVGTMEQGLYIFDSTRQKVEHFFLPGNDLRNNIYSLAEDNRHRIWAATDNGVFVFDRVNNQYFILNAKDGLNTQANYTLMHVKDRMYIGGLNGMAILTEKPFDSSNGEKSLKYKYDKFDRKNGLLYRDFHSLNLNASDNKLWFPIDLKVLAVVNQPEEVSGPDPAYITGIKILDSSLVFSDFSFKAYLKQNPDTLWDTANQTFYVPDKLPSDTSYQKNNNIQWDSTAGPYLLPVNLKLPYKQNYLSFQFNLVTYKSRANIRYRYILEGIDLKWREVTGQNISENYRDLNPGKYVFKVSGSSSNGIWSKPAEMSFTILPPWWQSWWAYLIYILSFILSITAYTRFRARKLTSDKLQLENLIQIRTKELAQSLEDLKSAQSQLIQSEKMASLGELTAGIAHEIQNPLNFVNNFSDINQDLIDELNEEIDRGNTSEVKIIAESIRENESKINQHGKRADSIVKGMLQHSRASTGQKESTDINALADEYLRLAFHGLRAKDKTFNVTLETDYDNTLGKVHLIPQEFGRVLLNLYNNAFYAVMEKRNLSNEKFEPTVSVSTRKHNGKVEISVKDNGPGVPEKVKDKIFQPFFTTKPTGQGTGLGLSLSYDIIKAHGGELTVETKPGEGSRFLIRIPV
jgi:signal transduction histidine kinase